MAHRYPWNWRLDELVEPGAGAPTVFSTFACGGGSSMGYKRAGYHVVGNCEIDPRIAAVYEANLHPEHSYVMDLRDFNALDDLPDELYHLDVLDGSPPCSTFSVAGSREASWGVEKRFAEGQAMQRLDDLFFVFLDTVAKLRPKAFVAENVTGMLKGNAKPYTTGVMKKAREIGYDVQLFRLNAMYLGVPQNRERVFFIGNRMGYGELSIPREQDVVPFGAVRSEEGGRQPGPTVLKLARSCKLGGFKDIRETTVKRRGKVSCFNYSWNEDGKPAYTLTAGDRAVRACDLTFFTDQDKRNVASFPQDYEFGDASVAFITGMSVPPSMMAGVAHALKSQWLDKEKQHVREG